MGLADVRRSATSHESLSASGVGKYLQKPVLSGSITYGHLRVPRTDPVVEFQRSRRDDLHFLQTAGDLAGTIALGGKLEDQPNNRNYFRVCG